MSETHLVSFAISDNNAPKVVRGTQFGFARLMNADQIGLIGNTGGFVDATRVVLRLRRGKDAAPNIMLRCQFGKIAGLNSNPDSSGNKMFVSDWFSSDILTDEDVSCDVPLHPLGIPADYFRDLVNSMSNIQFTVVAYGAGIVEGGEYAWVSGNPINSGMFALQVSGVRTDGKNVQPLCGIHEGEPLPDPTTPDPEPEPDPTFPPNTEPDPEPEPEFPDPTDPTPQEPETDPEPEFPDPTDPTPTQPTPQNPDPTPQTDGGVSKNWLWLIALLAIGGGAAWWLFGGGA